jgi:hypothetical protein
MATSSYKEEPRSLGVANLQASPGDHTHDGVTSREIPAVTALEGKLSVSRIFRVSHTIDLPSLASHTGTNLTILNSNILTDDFITLMPRSTPASAENALIIQCHPNHLTNGEIIIRAFNTSSVAVDQVNRTFHFLVVRA